MSCTVLFIITFFVVKKLELELALTSDLKGSSAVNTGQLSVVLDGIENLNMSNYPKRTSGASPPPASSNPSAAESLPPQTPTR